jgi:hypothetical protein
MHSLNSALDGSEWLASRPRRFTPRERAAGTHWIGGWVGRRAVLDATVAALYLEHHLNEDYAGKVFRNI